MAALFVRFSAPASAAELIQVNGASAGRLHSRWVMPSISTAVLFPPVPPLVFDRYLQADRNRTRFSRII